MDRRCRALKGLVRRRWRLETGVIFWLNRFFSPPRFILHTEDAARKPREDLEEEEFSNSREGFVSLSRLVRFGGGVVLDLACGKGVKTTSYAAASPEARLVVGIDIEVQALQRGRKFSRGRNVGKVTFVLADAGALPFKDQCIDLVVSENALEHVPDPGAALREAGRVLKDQGILSLRFFPLYYSPYGSHLWDYLCIPWVHVWASPEAVVAAYGHIVEAETPRLLRVFAGRYDEEDVRMHVAEQIEQFTSLNRLTPRAFYRAVAASGGWRILDFAFVHTSILGRLLAYWPRMDRLTVWGIYCVLRRDQRVVVSARAFTRWRRRQDLGGVRRKLVAWTKAAARRSRG